MALPSPASAQKDGDKIYLGNFRILDSDILDEQRVVVVYTPPGYEHGDNRYPVMYLLDGPRHFHHVTGIVEFLTSNGLMPQMIVVGVANTDRTRDLTPTRGQALTGDDLPTAGGGDNFLRFFKNELIPFIENEYRTHDFRLLVGHSFGGLFTTYTMLTEPDMFGAYIAISPTFRWDDQLLSRKAKYVFEKGTRLNRFLYFSIGDEGEVMKAGADRFVKLLESRAPEQLKWHYSYLGDDDHGSTVHQTIYDGLRFIYNGWQLPPVYYDSSLASVQRFFDQHSERYGYEIRVPEVVYNLMGYQALRAEDFNKAERVFKKAITEYPGSANVYDSMGECYETMGKISLAEKNYAKAVERGQKIDDPNLPIYQNNLERIRKQTSNM